MTTSFSELFMPSCAWASCIHSAAENNTAQACPTRFREKAAWVGGGVEDLFNEQKLDMMVFTLLKVRPLF
jgi:hypothetical protein